MTIAAKSNHYLSSTQQLALEIVELLLRNGPRLLTTHFLNAGLITSWLRYVPFEISCHSNTPQKPRKAEVVRHIVEHEDRDVWQSQEVKSILECLLHSPTGKDCMVANGLWEGSFDLNEDYARQSEDVPEHMALRRQRRQAIVMGEEGR